MESIDPMTKKSELGLLRLLPMPVFFVALLAAQAGFASEGTLSTEVSDPMLTELLAATNTEPVVGDPLLSGYMIAQLGETEDPPIGGKLQEDYASGDLTKGLLIAQRAAGCSSIDDPPGGGCKQP